MGINCGRVKKNIKKQDDANIPPHHTNPFLFLKLNNLIFQKKKRMFSEWAALVLNSARGKGYLKVNPLIKKNVARDIQQEL